MEDEETLIEPLFEKAEQYCNTSYELGKLKTVDKVANLSSTFVSRGFSVIIFLLFLSAANVGIALWLGDLLGKSYYGFFCVAGFYAIFGSALHIFIRNWIKKWISNSIITNMLN